MDEIEIRERILPGSVKRKRAGRKNLATLRANLPRQKQVFLPLRRRKARPVTLKQISD